MRFSDRATEDWQSDSLPMVLSPVKPKPARATCRKKRRRKGVRITPGRMRAPQPQLRLAHLNTAHEVINAHGRGEVPVEETQSRVAQIGT